MPKRAADSSSAAPKRLKTARLPRKKIIEALEDRGVKNSSADTEELRELLEELVEEEHTLEPNQMAVADIRKVLKKRGLESVGDKAVLAQKLLVEFARLTGGGAEATFDPALLTVDQLREWLVARGLPTPPTSALKDRWVQAVKKAAAEEDEAVQEEDIESMSTEDIIQWLKDNNVKMPAKKGARSVYEKLMKQHMGKDADGVFLFTEDQMIYQKKLFFGQRLVVVKGNLVDCAARAIVHPTNSRCDLNGAVGRAIAKAHPKVAKLVAKDAKANGPVNTTECLVSSTQGSGLLAQWLIHTNSPKFDEADEAESKKQLHESIFHILAAAEANNCHNIALPSIGAGNNGYPVEVAAEVIVKSIIEYFQKKSNTSSIKQVYFVLFGDSDAQTYLETCKRL